MRFIVCQAKVSLGVRAYSKHVSEGRMEASQGAARENLLQLVLAEADLDTLDFIVHPRCSTMYSGWH